MAGAPYYYSTVDFNDPTICQAVNTEHLGNVVYISNFLSALLSRLGEGVAEPNLSCLQTLSTIADTPVPPTAPYAERQLENQAYAQGILNGYFYSLPRPQTLQSAQSDEQKKRNAMKVNLKWSIHLAHWGLNLCDHRPRH